MKEIISKRQLFLLTEIDDFFFWKKLLLLFIILITGFLFCTSKNHIFVVIGIIINGAAYAHALELQHQCLHYTAFKRRKLNYYCGVLLGLPMFVSFTDYRFQHLKHHKKNHTQKEHQFFNRKIPKNIFLILIYSFSLKRYYIVLKKIFRVYKISNKNIKNEYALMLIMLIIYFLILFYFNSVILIKIWFIPIIVLSEAIHYFIELPEHHNCEEKSNSVFKNTRTIEGGIFSVWFTNGNNFHVEHHLFSSIPIQNLNKLHNHIKSRIHYKNNTYYEFYMSLITKK